MCTCSREDACVRAVLFPHCNPHHRLNRHKASPVIAHHRSSPNQRRLHNTTTPQAKRWFFPGYQGSNSKKTEAARGTRLTPARILVSRASVVYPTSSLVTDVLVVVIFLCSRCRRPNTTSQAMVYVRLLGLQPVLRRWSARILVTSLEVAPLDLQKLLIYLKEEYGNPPIYIHENGQVESHNGTMADTPRVEFLHAYIGGVLDALSVG
ncbi:putative beta-glucosidase [Helianthus annuus]|uniref:Beta-glucosidase n=2 Tax=Helianthus annuus TaxID=4232 RepID=A0A9K3EJ26_HELAN|nr:putative beta-glucosidase [Helianthus annuus]KAJ0477918.1 putative beta-glucosidase [Helianthus annuus]KAJ0498749.1 putative beta-glucosidase [Helianthus annuus]KAJ0664770.1 putative beta-glucosidase [Helianthus annuus]KAJ0672210.1 putative beta-glucosidase [Helianthus annuus]